MGETRESQVGGGPAVGTESAADAAASTESAQLHLRRVESSDVDFLVRLANDPVVRANVVGWGFPQSHDEQAAGFAERHGDTRSLRFIIEDSHGVPLGVIGLWDIDWHDRTADVGFKLGGGGPVRARGFGTAALQLLMEFAFNDMGLHKLTASFLADNSASEAVFVRKCGWTVEGRREQQVWREGRHRDLVLVGILREAYLAGRARG